MNKCICNQGFGMNLSCEVHGPSDPDVRFLREMAEWIKVDGSLAVSEANERRILAIADRLAAALGAASAPAGGRPDDMRAAILVAIANAGISCLETCAQCREETVNAVFSALSEAPR